MNEINNTIYEIITLSKFFIEKKNMEQKRHE